MTAISQYVGQINGAHVQCNEVNLPAWKNLRDQIGNLREGAYCGEEAADSTVGMMGENPLRSIQLLANLVIEEAESPFGGIGPLGSQRTTIIGLQRHLLDAVYAMSDYFGTRTIERKEGPWEGDIPNAVWPDRSDEIECLIDAGGGLQVTDPKTGEILTNGEAQGRLQTHRDHLSRRATDVRRFRWKAGTPAYVHVTARNHLEEIRDTLFRMRVDDKPQSYIDEHARALFDKHLAYLQRDWPESPQLTILPRRIRGEKTIFDLINKIEERLQAFRLEDEELINAIHNAEEIAIAKGIQSGDCPLTPGTHVDMSKVSFNVPDEFHDTIRAGRDVPKTRFVPPHGERGLMYLDVAGVEIKLQHDPDRNVFQVDIHRRTQEPTIGGLRELKQFIYALRDANPGSSYEVVATDMKRARVYMRAGFEFYPTYGEEVDPKTGLPIQEEQRSVRLRLPRVPEAWFDQRSQALQNVINRGTSGNWLDVRDPQTGELISEWDAIQRLHYYPDEDTGFFPGDSEWFQYTEENSEWAKDVHYANQQLSLLVDDIDDQLFRGAITSDGKDGAAARLYEEWWQEHSPAGSNKFHSRTYDTLFGLRTTDDPPRWETLPRHVRSYLGLSSLVDKLGQRMDELEQEDEDMLKAIMLAEEEAIRRGTGGTPSAKQVCIPSAYPRWQTALMAARKWATEGWQLVNMPDWPTFEARQKDAEWALGMIDSLLAGDVEKRVAEESWETRESGIQRQLRLLLSHLDGWEGEDAEAAKASLRAVVRGESPARCTPSAEQVNIDPYIFLPLYWGARDRGEETFIYEGREILVAYARYMIEAAGWADITPDDLANPSAWYDHHPEGRQALIEDGGGYDIIHPVSGETIHLDEAEQSLNYLPASSSHVTAWGGEWFNYAHPQSDNAEFLIVFMDDIAGMIDDLEYAFMQDDPPLGLALDRKASQYYAEWISDKRAYWANYSSNLGDSQTVRDMMPDRINSLTQLYQLREKLNQYKKSLQDADMPMLKAIMLAEAEAMERGWLEQEQNPDAPGAYDPELVDRINANIDRLVSYGMRTEIATGYPSYVLSWSNASARWGIYARIHKKGEQVRLDANQILVQAARPAIEEALPLLHMLPLFSLSYEYTHRPPTLEEDDIPPDDEWQIPGAWEDMTPEEQERWQEEATIRAAEARSQIQSNLTQDPLIGQLEGDMWDIIMPQQSLMQWVLPHPRGEFPDSPRLRETRKSIYYTPGWVKIRAYQMKNPGLTITEIAKAVGYTPDYVSQALRGYTTKGQVYGPRLRAHMTEADRNRWETTKRRYGELHYLGQTPELKAEVVEAYQLHPDLSYLDLQDLFTISESTLSNILTEAGVERRARKWFWPEWEQVDDEDIREYKRLNPDFGYRRISQNLGIDTNQVRRALKEETPSADVQAQFPSEEPIRHITGEERRRLLAEYASKAEEARAQFQRELGHDYDYMNQDMWDIIMPYQSIYQWLLPHPRGEFPQTPLLRERPRSIFYMPGWVKIRAYQVKNPGLTVKELANETGYSRPYVTQSLKGHSVHGQYYGPQLHAAIGERELLIRETMQERYGVLSGTSGEIIDVHTPEFKANVVKEYVDYPDLSTTELGDKHKVAQQTIERWVKEAGQPTRGRMGVPKGRPWRGGIVGEQKHDYDAIREYKRLNPLLSNKRISRDLGINATTINKALSGETPEQEGQTPTAFDGVEKYARELQELWA